MVLPDPDVALEHAVHPPVGPHVGVYLLEDLRLGVGELEVERLVQRADEFIGTLEHDPRGLDRLPIPDLSLNKLEKEEFVEGQTTPRGLYASHGRRTVQDLQGLSEPRKAESVQLRGRQVLLVLDLSEEDVQVLLEEPPEDPTAGPPRSPGT